MIKDAFGKGYCYYNDMYDIYKQVKEEIITNLVCI